jgi:DNA-binding NarL/FixJ family response regulator
VASGPSASSPADPLVGREAELQLAEELVRGAIAGHGAVLVVEGEPGIGKSALLEAVAGLATAHGCTVLRMPEAGPSGDMFAAMEHNLAIIDRVPAETPTVLVVDDLHAADPATKSAWHRLARSAEQRGMLLAGALRPFARRKDLSAVRRAETPGSLMRLGPLPEPAVRDLVAALAGGVPGPRLAMLAKDAGGNPRYLAELVAALTRTGDLTVASGIAEVTGELDRSVFAGAIGATLDFLPAAMREVLRAAALLGTEFAVDELAVVVQRGPKDLLPVLREARSVGLLAESAGSLAFRHRVVQAALHNEVPAADRREWHGDAARLLYEAGASYDRVARQLLCALAHDSDGNTDGNTDAGTDGEAAGGAESMAGWAANWLIDAAPVLVEATPDLASQLLRRAAWCLPSGDPRRSVLASQLARALAYLARYHEVDALVGESLPNVADLNLLVDLHDTLARTHVTRGFRLDGRVTGSGHIPPSAPGLSHNSRLRLQALAALEHLMAGDPGRAEHVARLALADATEADDRFAMAILLNQLADVLANGGELREAAVLLDRGLAIAAGETRLNDVRLSMLAGRADVARLLDQPDKAHRMLVEARRIAVSSGKVRQLVNIRYRLAELYFVTGRWDEALAEADLPPDVDAAVDQCGAHSISTLISLHRHDVSVARNNLAIASRVAQRPVVWQVGVWVLARSLDREVDTDPGAALAILAAMLTADAQHSLWQVHVEAGLADTVRLATGLGQPEIAAAAAARAEKPASADPSARRRAIAAHCRGQLSREPELLLASAEAYGSIGQPLARAQALEAAAALQAEQAKPADARESYAHALEIFTELQAKWDIARLRARLRNHGFRVRRAGARPAHGWEALTRTETRIGELIAEGLSNREIAAKQVLSSRTVEVHVTKILAKLQVRSRVEVARVAAERRAAGGRP